MPQERQVNVRKSSNGGDGLFAMTDFAAGESIFDLERPLIMAVDTRNLPNFCSNCLIEGTGAQHINHDPSGEEVNLKACSGCKRFWYCSKECQTKAWKRQHKSECKEFAEGAKQGNGVRVEMRAVLQMLSQKPSAMTSPFETLESHHIEIAETDEERYKNIWMLSTAIHKTIRPNVRTLVIEECFAILQTNSFTLTTSTFDPIGVALDTFAAKANHSCTPNAFVVFDGAILSFRSFKPIAKDEEILISYIDNTMPFSRRQKDLRSQYFFTCRCPKCQLGEDSPESVFLKNPDDLDPKWYESVATIPDSLVRKWQSEDKKPARRPTGTNKARISACEEFASNLHNDIKKPISMYLPDSQAVSELKVLKEGLLLCRQIGVWSDTRQPVPSMRQDIYVHLMSSAFDGLSWSFAFIQGLTLYFRIHPHLYPETFHPTRLIHKWSLAHIVLMLGEPSTPVSDYLADVDFGIVAFGLLAEVQDNVAKSHGESSRFAKTVRGRFEQLRVDMTRGDGTQLQHIWDRIEGQWSVLRRLADLPDEKYWMARV